MEFIDLKAQYRALKSEIDANIQAVLDAGQFIGGAYVEALEEKLAAYVGRKHCIACGNGTDALQAAYMALGVGAGDAVFCPDVTFISSVEPAYMLGAVPVFCDISPDSYNLDPASLERQVRAVLAEGRLTPKAVVAVDFLGNPCDYDAIEAVCEKYGPAPFGGRRPEHGRLLQGPDVRFLRDRLHHLLLPGQDAGLLRGRRRHLYRRRPSGGVDALHLRAWQGPGRQVRQRPGGVQLPAGQPPGRDPPAQVRRPGPA